MTKIRALPEPQWERPLLLPQRIDHPMIRGLIEHIPAVGSEWPEGEREQWLVTARHVFSLIYREPAAPARDEETSQDPGQPQPQGEDP